MPTGEEEQRREKKGGVIGKAKGTMPSEMSWRCCEGQFFPLSMSFLVACLVEAIWTIPAVDMTEMADRDSRDGAPADKEVYITPPSAFPFNYFFSDGDSQLSIPPPITHQPPTYLRRLLANLLFPLPTTEFLLSSNHPHQPTLSFSPPDYHTEPRCRPFTTTYHHHTTSSDGNINIMLMPSAFACDLSQQQQHHQSTPRTRLQAALLASPPASPPSLSSQGAFGDIFSTCRSLQTLLSTPPPQPVDDPVPATQLPTPPLAYAPPPLKLRLRPRPTKPDGPSDHLPRKKIIKRAPPRGANKRRRALHDEAEDEDEDEDDGDTSQSDLESSPLRRHYPTEPRTPPAPRTPKRARIAPEVVPLGLERSDYHNLRLLELGGASDCNNSNNFTLRDAARGAEPQGTNLEVEADGESWSVEDDRILVELVLEKLKLTKTEWQDCARNLGKDRNALSRRWKSLMSKGDVGLKGTRASRRVKIHATWR
ncbi:hypothetical protein SODALDRAFT_361744 [Sodiomyces alkalinus F11]|uniref:Myb-like domain-containing protein n=1 Tax=Sodiomyces alkalinus (strain CBS 110278 / VKM F-3762 / F11) TaxID=1314773 RepID=A0A3N2PQX9_SODAK|nr:hypothetical protein SODALDRAFT_361744 [Sodiomyces alkalinus F11]ROT36912.1 hypothetical protein SODALDRAFT_361744 [Sodiomyces alkalinus F11]